MATAQMCIAPKVGGSNPPPATNSGQKLLKSKLASYLQEIELLRKPGTLREATRICFEALPYLSIDDPRGSILLFLHHCKVAGNEARTLENKRIRLLAFLKHADLKVKLPTIRFTLHKPEVYTQAELDGIMAHANGRDHWLYKTLLMAGLRMQEAMTLDYINLTDSGIQVTSHGDWSPKDHEERTVRVPRSLIESLRSLPPVGGSSLLFPTERGTINWHMLRTLKRTAKRAGLDPEKCWLHKFRANFATKQLRAGMTLPDVMTQMGHSSPKSTMRYLACLGDADMQSKIESIWG